MKEILVKSLMSKKVETANPTNTFMEIAEKMSEHDIGCLPIVEDKEVVGIITDRDLVVRGIKNNVSTDTEIGEYMTCDVISIGSKENIEMALNLMGKFQIKRLLVIDKNKLMGVLSLSDIVLNETINPSKVLKEIYSDEHEPNNLDSEVDEFDL